MAAAAGRVPSRPAPPGQPGVRRTGAGTERGAGWHREDVDQARTLERLEAALCGLAELRYWRRTQRLRVQHALTLRSNAGPVSPVRSGHGDTENRVTGTHEAIYPAMEEQLVEQNLVLLRRQLDCWRRQDAGLVSHLQELDHQMNDLRLDTGESHDQESDSRASSGFYELSDGASGSLSNSSMSVFSESLSSCHSSTCDSAHYHPVGSHCLLDGPLPLSAECEVIPLFSGTFPRSFSSPSPPPAGPSSLQSSIQTRAPPVQGPEPAGPRAPPVRGPEPAGPRGPAGPNRVCPLVSVERHAHLDHYISALLQRRVPPPRPGRARTSITTDPTLSTLRQARLGAPRGGAAAGTCKAPNGPLETPEPRVCSLRFLNTNESSPPTASLPKRPKEEEEKEEKEPAVDSAPRRRSPRPAPYRSAPKNTEESSGPPASRTRLAPPRNNHKPRPSRQTGSSDRVSLGPSSHTPQEGMGHVTSVTVQAGSKHGGRGSKSITAVQEENRSTNKEARSSEQSQRRGHQRARCAGSPRFCRGSWRPGGVPATVPEDQLLDKHATSSRTTRGRRPPHPHHHPLHRGRGAGGAVATPRYKRKDAARPPAPRALLSEEARRPERGGRSRPTSGMLTCSSTALLPPPHSYALLDTSEEDHSYPTSNCFADQESGEEDTMADSLSCSDPEESGGGGGAGGGARGAGEVAGGGEGAAAAGGGGARQVGGGEGADGANSGGGGGGAGVLGRRRKEAGRTQDIVKIKASRNLKKKLLHFRWDVISRSFRRRGERTDLAAPLTMAVP